MEKAYERLLRYAAVDTKSNPDSDTCPSTPGQKVLGAMLVEELKALGLSDAEMDENGYVFATLEGNAEDRPTIGLLAHVDTSPDYPGECKNTKIVRYEGGDIPLENGLVISRDLFPGLAEYEGHDLIVTDGNTLLGADDKAGIAAIMTAVERLIASPEIPRGRLRVGFTPDEEIGRGPHRFDVEKFNADFAYTLDGGPLGELEYESFNAAEARIKIRGESIHPGTAKDRMINASLLGMELHGMLPVNQRPEYTEGYEGFYMLSRFRGDIESCEMRYIVRDHDREKFEAKKRLLEDIVDFLRKKYGDRFELSLEDTYYNMGDVIRENMHLVTAAEKAMLACDVTPVITPIRGGTDGSQLSYMGLPTPNLFTGGMNFHGPYELISIQALDKAADVIVKLVSSEDFKGLK